MLPANSNMQFIEQGRENWGAPLGVQWYKNPYSNVGDACLISGLGRYPGEGNGSPLQYPCLENAMDR